VLTVKGSKKEENKDEKSNSYSRSQRSYQRSFTLPEDVDPAEIKAKMEHGVLEITIPKPKEAPQKNTAITIN